MAGSSKQGSGGVTDVEKKTKAAQEREERQEHKDNMEIVRALDGVTHQLKAGQKLDNASEKKRSSRECLTIILLFLTVIFTGWSAIVFNRQLDAMHAAERPYIGIDEASGAAPGQPATASTTPDPEIPVFWSIVVRNYGRSTATMQYQVRIKLRNDMDFECGDIGCDWSNETEMVPTQRAALAVNSQTGLTEKEFKRAMATNEALVVFIRMRYRDSYGTEYMGKICVAHHVIGKPADCGSQPYPK